MEIDTDINPVELLTLAREIATPAGDLAQNMRPSAIRDISTKSTPTDVVTAADRAVEGLIVARILAARPDDTILGEEGSGTRGKSPVRWLIDPIDGTVNYIYGLPQYAVSIAAEINGRVVAGLVRNPATGDEWTATKGGGAKRGGARLSGSPITDLSQALVATGFSYDVKLRAQHAEMVAALMPRIRDIRRFGAAALDLCLAAEGLVDAYFERDLKPWDIGAGGLIAREAGLTVTGLHRRPAGNEFVLAAPSGIHADLHDALIGV